MCTLKFSIAIISMMLSSTNDTTVWLYVSVLYSSEIICRWREKDRQRERERESGKKYVNVKWNKMRWFITHNETRLSHLNGNFLCKFYDCSNFCIVQNRSSSCTSKNSYSMRQLLSNAFRVRRTTYVHFLACTHTLTFRRMIHNIYL